MSGCSDSLKSTALLMMPESVAAALKNIFCPLAETTETQQQQQQITGCIKHSPSFPPVCALIHSLAARHIASPHSQTTPHYVRLSHISLCSRGCRRSWMQVQHRQHRQLHNKRSSGGGGGGAREPWGGSGGPSAGSSYHVCVVLGQEGRQLRV